ncbi:MAG: hypothetical protein K5900_07075, partial [Butyrivibrio sp.]|nr:hypothetical protein [Butyrivibrio sp.]
MATITRMAIIMILNGTILTTVRIAIAKRMQYTAIWTGVPNERRIWWLPSFEVKDLFLSGRVKEQISNNTKV